MACYRHLIYRLPFNLRIVYGSFLENNRIPTRHQQGDLGKIDDLDKGENDNSINGRFKILTAYRTRKGVKIWVATEAETSATTSFCLGSSNANRVKYRHKRNY